MKSVPVFNNAMDIQWSCQRTAIINVTSCHLIDDVNRCRQAQNDSAQHVNSAQCLTFHWMHWKTARERHAFQKQLMRKCVRPLGIILICHKWQVRENVGDSTNDSVARGALFLFSFSIRLGMWNCECAAKSTSSYGSWLNMQIFISEDGRQSLNMVNDFWMCVSTYNVNYLVERWHSDGPPSARRAAQL